MWRYDKTKEVFTNGEAMIIPEQIEICLNVFTTLMQGTADQAEVSEPVPQSPGIQISGIEDITIHDSVNAPKYKIIEDGLALEREAYSDRNYQFTYIPEYLIGKSYLQSANDSKHYVQYYPVMEFWMITSGILYLAIEEDQPVPEWVRDEGWEGMSIPGQHDKLGIKILDEDVGFELFKKVVSPGNHIELGAVTPNMWVIIFDIN